MKSSDIATEASISAIKSSSVNPETIDYIILAHNIGDVTQGSNQLDAMPSLASRVKSKLGIENPNWYNQYSPKLDRRSYSSTSIYKSRNCK